MTPDSRSLLRRLWSAPHGGYPGDVVAHEEYLACIGCGWAFTLEDEDTYCYRCGDSLEVRRVNPAPESTMRMALDG